MLNNQSLQAVQNQLALFAAQGNFDAIMTTAFGSRLDRAKLQLLRQQWLSGNFSVIPDIQILSQGELGTANGAYAASLYKIFVSSDFLAYASESQVTTLILEEVGHRLDQLLNGGVDSAGDEGEIFSRLVNGENLSASTLAALRAEDDRGVIIVNGVSVAIEKQVYTGGDGNDTFYSTSSNSILYGNNGDDQLYGNKGNDNLFGGDGNDYLDGGRGNDYLYGDEGNDYLFGNSGSDQLSGNNGNDSLDGGEGNDLLFGGDGNDYLFGDTGNDQLSGNNGNDFLDGADGNDFLSGGDGDDSLRGGNGDDTLYGNLGNNLIYGVDGNDSLRGDSGSDSLHGEAGNDSLFGYDSNDSLYGGIDNDYLDGGNGNDYLYSDFGSDYLLGYNGNDTLIGYEGNDTIYGGFGNDSLNGGISDDELLAEEGDDTLEGDDGDDYLNGGLGNDYLSGGNNNDLIYGWNDADRVNGGNGDDIIFGGYGNDTLDGGLGLNSIYGEIGDDNLIGGGNNNFLYGGDGNDWLLCYGGNDSFYGDNGDDNFTIIGGKNSLYGGSGNDTYYLYVVGTEALLAENANEGKDSVYAINSYTLGGNIENLFLSKYRPDLISLNGTGNSLDNQIVGEDGINILTGNAGNDTLTGSKGDDTLIGNENNDVYIIDADVDLGFDTIIELAAGGIDALDFRSTSTKGITVNLAVVTNQLVATGVNVIMPASTIEYVFGGSGNDSITGNAASNYFIGGVGNDTIAGGLGNEIYAIDADVDLGFDTIIELAAGGIDTLDFRSTSTKAITVNLGSFTNQLVATGVNVIMPASTIEYVFGGAKDDNLTGNSLNNYFLGGAGNDNLKGGIGRDYLVGGAGNDILSGGVDIDTFNFNGSALTGVNTVAAVLGRDTIVDFAVGTDKIALSNATFTKITNIVGGTIGSNFIIVASDDFVGSQSAAIVYSSGSGNLFYNSDEGINSGVNNGLGINGGNFAFLTGKPALTANSFTITA
jgi:Ca2+-binding RTX toxin-like protein